MGASVRPREFDVDQPSQTEQLANWISRVRSKKMSCRRRRRRNLRIEAVLTSVLSKAENELRSKQISRIMRWQQMKQRMLEEVVYKDVSACKDGGFQDGEGRPLGGAAADTADCYGDAFCSELSSLDEFMAQLSEIKVPLQR